MSILGSSICFRIPKDDVSDYPLLKVQLLVSSHRESIITCSLPFGGWQIIWAIFPFRNIKFFVLKKTYITSVNIKTLVYMIPIPQTLVKKRELFHVSQKLLQHCSHVLNFFIKNMFPYGPVISLRCLQSWFWFQSSLSNNQIEEHLDTPKWLLNLLI